MDTIQILYKPPFLTPLQTLDMFRVQYPEYKSATLGYAGRLDPLAEGLLVVLVNEENAKRKEYERLHKEYTFSGLFGVATDTYDYMGVFTQLPQSPAGISVSSLQTIISSFLGKQQQHYPPFSSIRVNGKPLYYWARKNEIPLRIPTKEIEIFDIKCTKIESLSLSTFASFAINGVSKVQGTFRQVEIIKQWKNHINSEKIVYSADFHVQCSSGTYVRGIIHEMGNQIHAGAIAYNIKRIKVGQYTEKDAVFLT